MACGTWPILYTDSYVVLLQMLWCLCCLVMLAATIFCNFPAAAAVRFPVVPVLLHTRQPLHPNQLPDCQPLVHETMRLS